MSESLGGSLTAPSSINDLRTEAHLQIGQRLGTIDLAPLLIYTFLETPPSLIPFLAWQFDIVAPWWQLLTGPESQLAIIRQAISLHRFKGTVFAIEAIMAGLGFQAPVIEEGEASWGGTRFPPSQGWALFRVIVPKAAITLASPQPASWDAVSDIDVLLDIDTLQQAAGISGAVVTQTIEMQAVSAIDFFKPERSLLDSLWFQELPIIEPALAVSDFITLKADNSLVEPPVLVSDIVTVPAWAVSDAKTTTPLYSAHFFHAGITHGANEPAVVDSGIVINGTPTE
jgi:hypothetical protein